jgi:hypothetical protein
LRAARAALILALALGGCVVVQEPEITAEPEAPQVVPDAVAVIDPAPEPLPAPEPPLVAPPVAPPVTKVNEVAELLAEFHRLRKLPGPELVREQEAARVAFAQSRSERSRIRLAMTLAVPGSPVNDESRALELLEPVAKNSASPLQGLAFLLGAYILEQRRLAGQVHGLQQSVQGLQSSVQALQQKLDALKTLERALTERGEGAAPRRR